MPREHEFGPETEGSVWDTEAGPEPPAAITPRADPEAAPSRDAAPMPEAIPRWESEGGAPQPDAEESAATSPALNPDTDQAARGPDETNPGPSAGGGELPPG